MKRQFLIVTAITSIGSVAINQANGCTLQLPAFEITGFPITRHQVAVLGSAQVEESAATPETPASPSQIAILTPRAKTIQIAGAAADDLSLLTVGTARLGLHKGARRASCGSE